MTSDIDPVQFGRLLASVEQLTETLDETRVAMTALTTRISVLESRYASGKGVVFGIVLGAGFALKGVLDTLTDWFK